MVLLPLPTPHEAVGRLASFLEDFRLCHITLSLLAATSANVRCTAVGLILAHNTGSQRLMASSTRLILLLHRVTQQLLRYTTRRRQAVTQVRVPMLRHTKAALTGHLSTLMAVRHTASLQCTAAWLVPP